MLSIIIPVYNVGEYLKECLDSIYDNDDLKINFEVIIINDGSTDNSLEICNNYILDKNINNMTVYSIENHGVSYARNYGIKKAKNKYIMFMDSDDKLNSNFFELMNNLDNNDSDIIYYSKELNKYIEKNDLLYVLAGIHNFRVGISGPFSKLFKRSFILSNKLFFNTSLINGEDMLFNIECLLKSKKYDVINDSFYLYRIRYGSATKVFDEKIIESDMSFHTLLRNVFNNNNIDHKTIDELCSYSLTNAVFVLTLRISLLKGIFNSYIKLKKLISMEHYNIKFDYKYMNKKKKMFLCLIKKKLLFLTIIVLKIFNLIKVKNKKEYFINI